MPSPESPYVVLGATGNQGSAVLHALQDAGKPVRAVVRFTDSDRSLELADRGIPLAVADIATGKGLDDAFADAAGVFALTTPFESGADAEVGQGDNIIAAAMITGVPHLVFSSVASADRNTGVPHFDSKYEVEKKLAASSIPHTIVGPTYFYDNLLGGLDALKAGVIPMGMPAEKPLQQLSRRDLGRFVAMIFDAPADFAGRRIDLASDEITPDGMAEAVSAATGERVHAESFDPERISSPDMRAMFTFLATEGYSVDVAALHAAYPQIGWESFSDWAQHALG
ncbi:NmrA/HSCARG family protein [Gordonia aichiensis]|uniref:NmrA-like domain-containing protein n=1 Tax=Gordonia aichiensis NBRC 108223 TaxID=1220583 RepID=L7KG81_9ACTN|nr:NmrA/HSCARG family protein [Gordonia aichiensis]GAC47619.1 hypothetical protein GOACH_04_00130 [Gordonia aichiensis NBRC 108223]